MSFKKIFIFSVFALWVALLGVSTAKAATLNVQDTLNKMNGAYGDYSNLSLLYEKYQQSTENFLVTVNASDKVTGNYEYKHIVRTNPKRKRDIVLAQLESPITSFKIKDGTVYRTSDGFDYPIDSLTHFITERFYPGFEELFIESLENVSVIGTATENFYLVYADLPVTAGSTLNIIIQVDKSTHLMKKIEYYVDAGYQFLFKSVYLNYVNHSGEYFLERIGTIYSQAAFIDVERFYSPDYVRIPKKDFNLNFKIGYK
jgi:hypothetical protein